MRPARCVSVGSNDFEMLNKRVQKAKINIITTFLCQIVVVACGLVVPHIMIATFGSEVNGATASIAQFLSYIALLEGGIGAVARAELYEPLSNRNLEGVSNIYYGAKRLLRYVGIAFVVYTLFIACFYHDIAGDISFDRFFTFCLVCVISISSIAQYFSGLADQILLNADQKRYICNLAVILTTILNTIMVVVLTRSGSGVITVKLVSSCIFVLRPILFSVYVKKHYALPHPKTKATVLRQRWTGLGQHLAYFFHTNTDIVMLTLLADLKTVSVYSVYNLITGSMRNLVISFLGGMEAVFGDMIAKNERDSLRGAFRKYQFLLSTVSIVLFGTTACMILPFVRLYTANISDAHYMQPLFAYLLVLAEVMNCMMQPCSSLPVAANQLKETRWGAYGEVSINVFLSLLLIRWNPLAGVAIGTLVATVFKGVYYMVYACKSLLQIPCRELLKYFLFTLLSVGLCILAGVTVMSKIAIDSFLLWTLCAALVFGVVLLITVLLGKLFFPLELASVVKTVTLKNNH